MVTRIEKAYMKLYREDALRSQGKRCYYCLDPICLVTVTGDHVIPRSKGGSIVKANIVAACQWCNSLKGNQDPEAFLRLILHPSESTLDEYHIIRARRQTTMARLLGAAKKDAAE
jgi:5-methylcytosine-specific restriction endonuclease McrA